MLKNDGEIFNDDELANKLISPSSIQENTNNVNESSFLT